MAGPELKLLAHLGSVMGLRVEGTRLVEGKAPTSLRGASIADPAYLDWEGELRREHIRVLASWGANTIRVPVHPIFWRRLPDYAERYLDLVLSWAREESMYAIIDWHAIGNPITRESPFPSWARREPWGGPPYDPDLRLARSFWAYISRRYLGWPNVIYELFNEPAWISWRAWVRVAEFLLRAVRENDEEAPVLVAGTSWCYDLSWLKKAQVKDSNVAYATHVYPCLGLRRWDKSWGSLCHEFPILITEWGFKEDASIWSWHLRGSADGFGRQLMKYARGRVAGWVAWVFHPTWEPNMLANWRYELTSFGSFVREQLALHMARGNLIKAGR